MLVPATTWHGPHTSSTPSLAPPLPPSPHRCLAVPPAAAPPAAMGEDFEDALSQPDSPGKVVQITVRALRCGRGRA